MVSPDSVQQKFLSACRAHNFIIPDSRLRLLEQYVSLLLAHNKNLNLISRKDEENVWTSHILHCAGLLFHRKFPSGSNILDLGTGGGLPGIVYAILHPALALTLLDATRKKVDAVESMVNELHLPNVRTVWGRAEDMGRRSDYAGKFDIVVARGVAPLEKLAKWAKLFLIAEPVPDEDVPMTIPLRSLVTFKGGDVEDEIGAARKKIRFRITDVISLDSGEGKKVVILTLV
jgi:16S rRNA (guanine527-N7)-methyltransferase